MKLDRVIKVSLVLIAVFLGIIALRPVLEPASALANPEENLSQMQVSFHEWGYGVEAFIFDPKDRNVWVTYANMGTGHNKTNPIFEGVTYLGKLPEVAKPAK